MQKRVVASLGATAGALALILSFKTPQGANRARSTLTSTTDNTNSTTQGEVNSTVVGGSVPTRASTTTIDRSGARTINGDSISTRYGNVEVAVTFRGKQITDVKPIQLPFSHRRSQEISDQAAPLLHEEVLQAQSAQIDSLSGATYTSQGYADSVQSAIDKANQ